eukprot:1140734-Pelagomonas_calceolata.AAC.2
MGALTTCSTSNLLVLISPPVRSVRLRGSTAVSRHDEALTANACTHPTKNGLLSNLWPVTASQILANHSCTRHKPLHTMIKSRLLLLPLLNSPHLHTHTHTHTHTHMFGVPPSQPWDTPLAD